MIKNPHITPEGYFDSLKQRLSRIPQQQERVSLWQRVSPHLAIAAAFIAIVTAGTAILKTFTGSTAEDEFYSQYELAGLVRTASPYMYDNYYDEEDTAAEDDVYTEDDLVSIAIDSGLTIENIEDDETEY